MGEQFVFVPVHFVGGIERYGTQHEAAVAAANAVAKDRVPRVVVQLQSEVRATHQPRVDIVRVA